MYTNRPLVQQLMQFIQQQPTSFHVPGHKYGQLSGLPPQLKQALAYDVTELTGLDYLHEPEEVLKEAQQLLAQTYRTNESFFLVNGSTVGNLAMIYATCKKGDTIIVQRNAHKSIFHAIELVEAKPVFVAPTWNEQMKAAGNVSRETIEQALQQYPQCKAVVLTSPTYYGIVGDTLEQIITVCHRKKIPVLVDEAHGAHFIAGEPFPKSALTLGADVVVHSAHKTLPAMTMASFLHVNSTLVCSRSVKKYLTMLQSSSPSYVLMASLDDARAFIETYDEIDKQYFLQMRKKFIKRLANLAHLEIVPSEDPLKLLIRMKNYTGFQLLEALEMHNVYGELADPYQVLFILPLLKKGQPFEIEKICERIEQAVWALSMQEKNVPIPTMPLYRHQMTELCYSSQELASYQPIWCTFDDAVGKVSAEMITPYPPGIPLLMAGERITAATIETIEQLVSMNARFHGKIHLKKREILVINDKIGE